MGGAVWPPLQIALQRATCKAARQLCSGHRVHQPLGCLVGAPHSQCSLWLPPKLVLRGCLEPVVERTLQQRKAVLLAGFRNRVLRRCASCNAAPGQQQMRVEDIAWPLHNVYWLCSRSCGHFMLCHVCKHCILSYFRISMTRTSLHTTVSDFVTQGQGPRSIATTGGTQKAPDLHYTLKNTLLIHWYSPMAEFVSIWRGRASLLDALEERQRFVKFRSAQQGRCIPRPLCREADASRGMEEYAAITVQRHFRGARVRSEIVLNL